MTARRSTLAALAWHKIGRPPAGGWETWNYVPEAVFAVQIRLLAELGYEVIDHATVTAAFAGEMDLPARSALLTFDDGYASMLHTTLPLLQEFGLPAVLFVPTAHVGGHSDFDGGNEPRERICSWEELRQLHRHGVAIQSHGTTHHAFSGLDVAEQQRQLTESKQEIEQQIGAVVSSFAFPYGDPGQPPLPAEIWQRAGYAGAWLYKGGVQALPAANRYCLTRVAVGPDTDLRRHLGNA